MGILFFIAFVILGYLYMTQLIIPWYNFRKAAAEAHKFLSVRFPEKEAKQVKITTSNLPPINVTLPIGAETVITVAITEPVLLISKQDDVRIYYPDNSVEYLSVLTEKWEKVQTTYRSVYEYATRTDCIIVENL